MDEREMQIVSIHLETPTFLDKLLRKATDFTYVVEFRHPKYCSYGGIDQKRHQRRYGDFASASRRLDYLLVKHTIHKAFILDFPIDVEHYTETAKKARAVCRSCGSHDWSFEVKE